MVERGSSRRQRGYANMAEPADTTELSQLNPVAVMSKFSRDSLPNFLVHENRDFDLNDNILV